jgi:hypothetical protein
MPTNTPICSPTFNLVAERLIALHRCTSHGPDDSPEAETIRDSLDVPLKALSPVEYERSRWLSEDLYSIFEDNVGEPQSPTDYAFHPELSEFREARRKEAYDEALRILREAKSRISPPLLSVLRGTIWLQLGNMDVANVFIKHGVGVEVVKFSSLFGDLHVLQR